MMHAVIHKSTRQCEAFVHSTDGYDPEVYDFIEVPGDPAALRWSPVTEAFVARPLTQPERVAAELAGDPRWAALKQATPAQVDAWLASNVTNLQEARQVLRFLILAVKRLAIDARTGL